MVVMWMMMRMRMLRVVRIQDDAGHAGDEDGDIG